MAQVNAFIRLIVLSFCERRFVKNAAPSVCETNLNKTYVIGKNAQHKNTSARLETVI